MQGRDDAVGKNESCTTHEGVSGMAGVSEQWYAYLEGILVLSEGIGRVIGEARDNKFLEERKYSGVLGTLGMMIDL